MLLHVCLRERINVFIDGSQGREYVDLLVRWNYSKVLICMDKHIACVLNLLCLCLKGRRRVCACLCLYLCI